MNDRIFVDNSDYLVVEGVVLNHELITKYNNSTWYNTVISMYESIGDEFFKDFRGSFSGIFYDKKLDDINPIDYWYYTNPLLGSLCTNIGKKINII